MVRLRARGLLGLALILGLVAVAQSWTVPETRAASRRLRLEPHVARDPVLVMALSTGDLPERFERLVTLADRFSGDDQKGAVVRALADWESESGLSIRDDVLDLIGPELVVVLDLPSNETVMAAFSTPNDETIAELLHGIGKVMLVRDAARLDDALSKLFGSLGADISTTADGMKRVDIVIGQDDDEGFSLDLSLYYAFGEEILALGFSPEWVRTSLAPRSKGQRLEDGEDFGHVFSHLDKKRDALFYLNLPKIATTIRESPLIRLFAARNPRVKAIVDTVLSEEYSATGLGSTRNEVAGGLRTSNFGPPGLSSGSLVTGAIAAVVVPRLVRALERGEQTRSAEIDGD